MEFFTPSELAEKLKVSRAKIQALIIKGEIQAIRVGNRWRVSAEAFENFIQGSAHHPVPERPRRRRLVSEEKVRAFFAHGLNGKNARIKTAESPDVSGQG